MSRAKAKLAVIHDLQSRLGDIILTKKDCDEIAYALLNTYGIEKHKVLYYYLKDLSIKL